GQQRSPADASVVGMKREQPSAHAGAELDFTQAAKKPSGNRARKPRMERRERQAILFGSQNLAGVVPRGGPRRAHRARGGASLSQPPRPDRRALRARWPTEFIIRLPSGPLTALLRQPFVIENRPGGAGGTVGAKSVASAEADGYTLLFSSPGPLVTAAAVYRNLDYDPIKSFAPIAMVIYAPQMLVVHPSVPADTLEGL